MNLTISPTDIIVTILGVAIWVTQMLTMYVIHEQTRKNQDLAAGIQGILRLMPTVRLMEKMFRPEQPAPIKIRESSSLAEEAALDAAAMAELRAARAARAEQPDVLFPYDLEHSGAGTFTEPGISAEEIERRLAEIKR